MAASVETEMAAGAAAERRPKQTPFTAVLDTSVDDKTQHKLARGDSSS